MIRAGEFRERLAIQSVTETRGTAGGVSKSWATSVTVSGRVLYLSGRELEAAEKINAQTSIEFQIRRRTDLTVKMRVNWNSQNWNINAILQDERKTMTRLLCSEVT